jgi:hypothetical protein|tara:strand:+ start:119 stop:520 length:402 start_codon:yes stop_codon:yes gene_type:complete
MSDYSDAPADKMTKAYIKIRNKRAELKAAFTKEDEGLAHQLDILKRALLSYCENNKVESVRTDEGLFFRSQRIKYWTSDWDAMHKFVIEHAVPELFDKRLNQTNIRQFLEENPELKPEGLNIDSEYVISVRKK